MVNLVVPYPMGFYAKTFDGRIDDPNAGWKGRGVWGTAGNRTPFHVEGIGKGERPKLVKFQMRPIPLAKKAAATGVAWWLPARRPRPGRVWFGSGQRAKGPR